AVVEAAEQESKLLVGSTFMASNKEKANQQPIQEHHHNHPHISYGMIQSSSSSFTIPAGNFM
ncbi:hypothetical protein U1Q18_040260, partial [Sarracenia purpurea var. burkii]